MPDNNKAIKITIQKACSFSEKGTRTFMPYKLAIKIGMDKMMVTEVKNLMVIFRLFEIMEECAPIMFPKMLL